MSPTSRPGAPSWTATASITTGFEHGDQEKLASGRQAMLQWRDTIVEVAEELRALRDRVGVELSDITPS